MPAHAAVREAFGDFGAHQTQPFVIHEIALGQNRNAAADAQQLEDGEVLLGLRHDAFIGSDDEQRDVDAGRAGEHVLDESFVAGDIDDAGLNPVREWERGKPEIDRDAAAFFLFPAIGVDTGEGFHQRRLPVIDVARGADYEPG